MRVAIVTTLIGCIIAGMTTTVSSIVYYPTFYIGISLTAIGILGLLFVTRWWRLFGNRGWKLYTSEMPTKPILYNEKVEVWRSENLQTEGMSCRLDLGKERRFDYVRFYHGNSHETPQKWRMWFFDKTNDYVFPCERRHPYVETGDPETKRGTVAIIVKLKQPISARFIDVKILEPENAHQWCIKAIRLRVFVFYGLIKHTIGNCWLDRV